MPGNPLLEGRTRQGNNKEGKNGYDNGNWPDHVLLREALHQYSKELLTRKQRLARLKAEFSLVIGLVTLTKLNKWAEVKGTREPIPDEEADQLVLNTMSDLNDREQRWGVNRTYHEVARRGRPLPRSRIRSAKLLNEPEAVDARYPGRKKIQRTTLTSYGPFAEINCDGHDKLAALALRMGPLSFPIYGMKDKWPSGVLVCRVIPNNRNAATIGHVFLDFVEEFQGISVQITVDKGSETGFMYAFQTSLRETYAPTLSVEEIPAFVALTSTNNIPIEGCWHQLREHVGRTLFHYITRGATEGIFNSNNQLHLDLANWIFPPLIQHELDEFRSWWNNHKLRPQKQKNMPSGTTPTQLSRVPEDYGGQNARIPVPQEAVDRLRQNLPVTREEAFRWVPDEFDELAHEVWTDLGQPPIEIGGAWDIFAQMVEPLAKVWGPDV